MEYKKFSYAGKVIPDNIQLRAWVIFTALVSKGADQALANTMLLNRPGDQTVPGVSGNSPSRPFPRMKASDSLARMMGMDFFISGMLFFIPFPFPNYGNGFFYFLPVPELWELIFFIPFPFPNLLFHRRESNRELDYYERYQFFQLPLHFSKQLY